MYPVGIILTLYKKTQNELPIVHQMVYTPEKKKSSEKSLKAHHIHDDCM